MSSSDPQEHAKHLAKYASLPGEEASLDQRPSPEHLQAALTARRASVQEHSVVSAAPHEGSESLHSNASAVPIETIYIDFVKNLKDLMAQDPQRLAQTFDILPVDDLQNLRNQLQMASEAISVSLSNRGIARDGSQIFTSSPHRLDLAEVDSVRTNSNIWTASYSWAESFAWDVQNTRVFAVKMVTNNEITWTPTVDGCFELSNATVDGLIALCLSETKDIKPIVPTVLVTHDLYISSEDLFDYFVAPFKGGVATEENKLARIQTLYVFKQWFKFNPGDFCLPAVEYKLKKFLGKLQQISPAWKKMFKRWFKDGVARCLPDPTVSAVFFSHGVKEEIPLFTFTPYEVAVQLTLKSHFLIRTIPVQELMNKRFEKPQTSPNLSKCSAFSNWVSHWVGSEILNAAKPKQRQKLVIFFLQMMKHLWDLRNFSDVMAVLLGLQQHTISRLKAVKNISGPDLKQWEFFNNVLSPSGNFKMFRMHQDSADQPAVPFLGMILKDLTFIEDGNVTYIDAKASPKFLNMDKVIMLAQIIARLQYVGNVHYQHTVNTRIQNYLNNVVLVQDREKVSLTLEPREEK